jgi:hypothetical protein
MLLFCRYYLKSTYFLYAKKNMTFLAHNFLSNWVRETSSNLIYKNVMCLFTCENHTILLIVRKKLEQILLKKHVLFTCYLKSIYISYVKERMTYL